MPDLDITGKSVSTYFANAYRLIRGRHDDVSIATALRRGLAQHARMGGVPNLTARAQLALGVAGGALFKAVLHSHELLLNEGGSRNANLAHRALTRMLADGHRPASLMEAEHLLARYTMQLMLEHRLLAGARVDPDVGMGFEEFQALEERLFALLRPDFDALARQLVDDPSGATIKLPPTPSAQRRLRLSTAEILAQELNG